VGGLSNGAANRPAAIMALARADVALPTFCAFPRTLKAASQLSFVVVEINKFSMFGTISMSRHET
jgi:hypothetical protein